MANLILGYSPDQDANAIALKARLNELGHLVWMDYEFFGGEAWEENLISKLTSADAFVALASPGEDSGIIVSEVGIASGYASTSGRLATIGVIFGEGDAPAFLRYFRLIRHENDDINATVTKILDIVAEWIGKRLAENQKTEEVVKRIEENSANYVNEALQEQRSQARGNRLSGTIWYGIGFLSLIGALAVVLFTTFSDNSPARSIQETVSDLLHSLVAVGILAACAKFGFALGKSFTSESMKNLDRIHAISFGKFYLGAYGKNATWQELKEVFQNWNLDRVSSFQTLESSQIEPNIASSIGQAVKELASKS